MEVTKKNLSLQKNILYNTVGMTINLACQWLITVLVVRLSSDFSNSGLLTLAMSVTNVFYAIASYSLRTFQVSDVNNKYQDYIYIQVRIVTSLISFLLCIIYSAVLYRDERFMGIVLYMIFRVIEAFIDILQGFAQKQMRMDLAGVSMAVRGIATVIVFAVVIILTDSFYLAVIGMIAVCVLVMVFFDYGYAVKLADLKGKFNPGMVREILIECMPMGIASALNTSIISIPRSFLDMIEGKEILGIYGALATPTVIVQVAATYVFNPMIPLYARYYTEKKEKDFYKLFYKTIVMIVVLSCIALGGAALLEDKVLPILLGKEIIPYTNVFIPMLVCTILNAVIWFLTSILVVIRDFKSYLSITVLAVILTAVAGYPLIQRFSMWGVNYTLYLAMVMQIVVFGIILWIRLKRNFKCESATEK